MKRRITLLMVSILIAFNVFTVNGSLLKVDAAESKTIEYITKEDAFVRSGSRGNTNYNYENITASHGAQYANKGYTVINTKYTPADEIMALMKFDLPTKEDVDKYQLDLFELEFHIFKNAGFKNATQDYAFYYSKDVSWSEQTLTWNTLPSAIVKDDAFELFSFETLKDDEYEFKKEPSKRIAQDVSADILKLIDEGTTEITVFVAGKNNTASSLLLHSKETNASHKAPRLIASNEVIEKSTLESLVDECSALKEEDYTTDSFTVLDDYFENAMNLLGSENTTALQIRQAYRGLKESFDNLERLVVETDNIAFNKPTRSNQSKKMTGSVTDGDLSTTWSGTAFPAYVDIDLMDTYALDKLQVYVPVGKTIYYTVYGSNDGSNYDWLYEYRNDAPATADGNEITFETPKEYRIVRIFLEFTGNEIISHLSEVKAYGKKTDTNTEVLRDGSLEEILGVEDFDDTAYNTEITKSETIENVYGIIDRTIGAEYRSWFTFELTDEASKTDFFELRDVNGKIHIRGNEGLSLTTGLNYYFKNYVKVHISEQTMQVNMPASIIPIGKIIRKDTPYQIRYAFNYCTLSYTFAFFGEEDWQRENDWLALNGVNVVLDLAGQEATWIKFLMNYGYSYDDAKDWLTGPAYTAWQFMNNMETLGGPVPDGYVKDRLELARSSQRWKNSLGMQTVLQGYGGMVPTNFNEFQPKIEVTKQKNWGGNLRPSMVATDSASYDELAEKFYEAQRFVYGETSDYYAVDPYHEGGTRPEGLKDETVSKEVLESLLKYDKDAVWVVQAWQSNPTNGLLKGMGDYRNDHVLIVDLVKYPLKSWTKYDKTKYGSTTLDAKEFNGTDWAWCLLGNFGGNPTMNGQMQVMVDDILKAQKESKHMKGIGIISEGTYDNPILYDLIFDLAWADESFDLNQWINNYIERRYGGITENARLAWQTMKDSNYNHGVRHTEEIFGLKNSRPQFQGTKNISYGADKLDTAFKLLVEDYDKFKNSECYLYDLREIMRQHVSNYAVLTNNELVAAKASGSLEDFVEAKERFLRAFDILNEVQATDKDQLAGEWIGKATDLVENYDDFSKHLFKINAKTLITTWGTNPNAGLKEYGWRNYEGMFLDLHKYHWEEYLDLVENDLRNGTSTEPRTSRFHFDYEWKWVLEDQQYTRDAKDSPEEVRAVVDKVIENCSITEGLSPDAGNLALKKPVTIVGNKTKGKVQLTNDGSVQTGISVSSTKTGSDQVNPEIIVDLIAEFQLSKINIVFDNFENVKYQYDIYTSLDGNEWTKLHENKTETPHEETGDTITINNDMARFVKLVGTKDSDEKEQIDLAVSELRVYGERTLPDTAQLQRFVDAVEGLDLATNEVDKKEQLDKLIARAKEAIAEDTGPDDMNSAYWNLYDHLITMDLSGMVNIALKKPVTAHNDPSGASKNINDGDIGTGWNSGRLSPTGKPYEHDPITPGWAILDLEDTYNIDEIRVRFPEGSLWYKYEIYVSSDKENWHKYAEKTSQNLPNTKEDNHLVESRNVRYIKFVSTDITVGSDGKRASYGVRELEVYGDLYKVANTENLEKLIKEIEALDEIVFTDESWSDLQKALLEAKATLLIEYVSQTEVDAAYETLLAAKENLVEKIILDYRKLTDLIIIAKDIDLSKYTKESGATLVTTIEKAESLLDKAKNQTEIEHMEEELLLAVEALVEIENPKPEQLKKEKLEALIKAAEEIDTATYTQQSVKRFNEALSEAKKSLIDATTQEELDAAYKNLSGAISGLTVISNPSVEPGPNANTPNVGTFDQNNIQLLICMMILSIGCIMFQKRKRGCKVNKK